MRRIICYYHFFTSLVFVVPEGCWEGRASHSSAFSSPWSHCWPSLTQSSLGCVWWGDSGTDWLFLRTSFLPHLLQLGVGNGYRSLWFRVQYLKWQMKFYYFILESSGFVFSKLIVIRLNWQLIQRLDLSTEWNAWGSYQRHLGNSGTHREVAWWAWIAVGRVHCRVKLLSVYMLLFWQSEYSCPTYTDTLLFREILSFFLFFFSFLGFHLKLYVRVIEDSRTSKLFLYKR